MYKSSFAMMPQTDSKAIQESKVNLGKLHVYKQNETEDGDRMHTLYQG